MAGWMGEWIDGMGGLYLVVHIEVLLARVHLVHFCALNQPKTKLKSHFRTKGTKQKQERNYFRKTHLLNPTSVVCAFLVSSDVFRFCSKGSRTN